MSRILHVYSLCLSSTVPRSNNLVIFHQRFSPRTLFPQLTLPFACSLRSSTFPMPINQGRVAKREQQWPEKPKPNQLAQHREGATATEAITDRLSGLSLSEDAIQSNVPVSPIQFGTVLLENPTSSNKGQKTIWKPKSYSTVIGASNSDVASADSDSSLTASIGQTSLSESREDASTGKNIAALSKLFRGPMGADFTVDNLTYCQAQIRATFYPKFENEKSDQEVRTRMIEMVSNGLATLEVSLKHSGSLFMYAGHKGGAYAKNSYGNIYTAVGVFVLGRMFIEAWGTEARRKQAEFNDFLENNRMCISMELVTAVLGDHGQRPLEDYVVVTAVTELGHGKPKFYSTPEIIAFCRTWRLPTNHVWLFSTRKSVTSFFAAYDALCEEGTATPVCKALDAVADISIPGSKDHIKVQGEILEGLVARIVSRESSKHMEKVLEEFPPTQLDGVGCNMGESLRDICATNRSDEKQQMKALLQSAGTSICPDFSDWFGIGSDDILSKNADRSVPSKFLQAHPADFSTIKLQEIIRLMKQRHFPAAFKCYVNFQKIESLARDNLYLKMVIHVHSDSAFRRYQKEMRHNPGLWPLYRGFFVDINLFKVNKEKAAEMSMNLLTKRSNGSCSTSTSGTDGLADEDANLMIKLKFLTYKLRTFLIRNGLSILFKEGPASYKAYYLKQMKTWGTSAAKQRDLSKMLDEWAVYIRRKYGNRQLSSSIYLSEAEPFLEQYAKRSAENQALIGSAGNLVRSEDFMAIVEGGRDEEGDLDPGGAAVPTSPSHSIADGVPRAEGLIVFFPGIPGCAKSALCKELLSAPGGLGDDRPVHSLMGDLIKGRYWQRVADERRRKPNVITLADKNAPNEEVWRQIEDMCRSTRASAVPIVPDSEGTDSNPFSLDALAVFIFRVLQRANHPGNLDQSSPNAGYVLLMFYHLYAGKNRREFESELLERFGSLVKMPLLKNDRDPLPDTVKATLDEGINLYKLHTVRHGRVDSTKGSYVKEWAQWEKRLREVLFGNAEYLNSIQVPFDYAVKHVLEQLRSIAQGNSTTPTGSEKRKFGNIVYAAVTLPVADVRSMLDKLADINPKAGEFFKQKDVANSLRQCHVTLAHKRSHGVTTVASYGVFLNQEVPVSVTALLYSDRFAALEAYPGSVDEEKVVPKNQWPHVTIWTAEGAAAKEANMLPQLVQDGKAVRVNIDPPMTATGVVEFY